MWFFIILIIFLVIYYLNSQKNIPINTAEAVPSTSTHKKIFTPADINSYIAGIPHRFGSDVDLELIVRPGSTITTQREPNNPHDKNAIRLYSGKVFIGFIPKSDNLPIAKHIDSGGSAIVRVTNVDPSDKWRGAKINIRLI